MDLSFEEIRKEICSLELDCLGQKTFVGNNQTNIEHQIKLINSLEKEIINITNNLIFIENERHKYLSASTEYNKLSYQLRKKNEKSKKENTLIRARVTLDKWEDKRVKLLCDFYSMKEKLEQKKSELARLINEATSFESSKRKYLKGSYIKINDLY